MNIFNKLLLDISSFILRRLHPKHVIISDKQLTSLNKHSFENRILLNELNKASEWFNEYAKNNRAKHTPDGDAKALTNELRARELMNSYFYLVGYGNHQIESDSEDIISQLRSRASEEAIKFSQAELIAASNGSGENCVAQPTNIEYTLSWKAAVLLQSLLLDNISMRIWR